MKGNHFVLLKGACVALLLCGSASLSSAQTVATLDEIVVTASRSEEKLREVTSNITVITEEMIEKSSASDLLELLRQQGIEVAGGNGGSGMRQIILRGMRSSVVGAISDITSSDVLVLLNGRRLGGSSPDYTLLPNVERIEIIRGPAAMQYGPTATAGVINIITKRGGEKPEIRADAGIGSYGLSRVRLAAAGQSKNGILDFSLGGGRQSRDDYMTGNGWVWEGTSPGSKNSINGDVGINIGERHRIGVNYNYSSVLGSSSPNLNPYVSHENPESVPYTGKYSRDATNHNTAFIYDGSVKNQAWNWQGRFSFGKFDQQYFRKDMEAAGIANPENWFKTQDYAMGMKQFVVTLGYDNNGIFALSGGLEYVMYNIDNISIGTGAGNPITEIHPDYKDFGAFISGKLRFIDDSLIFSAGGRFDSYGIKPGESTGYNDEQLGMGDRSETNFSPSIGVAYLPIDWLKLRANYSHGFKMPAPDQLWSNSSYYRTSPDLIPEKSKTWEVGMDAGWEFVNAGLTYFHTGWKDRIQSVNFRACTEMPCYEYINIKGATIAGFELAPGVDLGRAFKWDFTLRPYVNLTYLSTMRSDDPDDPNRRTPDDDYLTWIARSTMSYGVDFTEPNVDLKVNFNVRYVGKKAVRDFSASESPWVEYSPGAILDMSVEKGLLKFEKNGGIKIRAEVNNLFDKYDEPHPSYPGPGRNFYVGLSYDF